MALECGSKKRKTPDGPAGPLSWRLDPEASQSDWTIEIFGSDEPRTNDVVNKDDAPLAIYPVHKAVLSVGPKRCLYFVRLLQNHGFSEATVQKSRIVLHKLAADTFPRFLDYLYLENDDNVADEVFTTETVSAFHHLAQYFGVTSNLQAKCQAFWKEDMTVENAIIYYEQAVIFHDQEIMAAVVEVVWKNLDQINNASTDPEKPHSLMEASDSAFWLLVLQKNGGEPNNALSQTITYFSTLHLSELDADIFSQLTDPKLLPSVAWEAAIDLLKLEKKLLKLATVQDRCIEALATHWHLVGSRPLAEALGDMGPRILTCIMEQLNHSKQQVGYYQSRLHRAERNLPAFVVVEGAGLPAINGTFTREKGEYQNDAPIFSMEGIYLDGPATFRFHLAKSGTTGDKYKYWWVCAEPLADNGKEKTVYFYRSTHPDNGSFLPPCFEWKACNPTHSGTPTLTFIGEDF